MTISKMTISKMTFDIMTVYKNLDCPKTVMQWQLKVFNRQIIIF